MRQIEHDDNGALRVRFPFDRGLVERIKTLPHRRWIAAERCWSVPDTDVVLLVDLLLDDGFRLDAATREMYERMGGRAPLEDADVPPPATGLPLFDGIAGGSADPAPAPHGTPADFTVSRLNQRVREALEAAFPAPFWLVGEVSGFAKGAHRRIVSFHLVELEDGRKISEVSATLFEETRQAIAQKLARAGNPFQFEDEITVRLKVRVDLFVPWGSYRVLVEDLDVDYTLGEAARRREQIVRRLTDEGLVGLNPALPLPVFPLRIGLITSLGSDAYNDVLRTFQESGFAFRVTVHGARVQGRQTEPSVLHALRWFRERRDDFDAVLICRGGGSRTDLAWFDSEPLGREVATFPLPVIVGIGHERDHSVLDAVARRAKTPTAAAALVVDCVRAAVERVEDYGQAVLAAAAERLGNERREGLERGRRLARAARTLLDREQNRLAQREQRAVFVARAALNASRQALARWAVGIPAGSAVVLERQRGWLGHAARELGRTAGRGLGAARERASRATTTLAPAGRRVVAREAERLESRRRRLESLDPRRVVERGFSILRLTDGTVLTRAAAAPPGTSVRADLRDGSLRLTSQGSFEPGETTDG